MWRKFIVSNAPLLPLPQIIRNVCFSQSRPLFYKQHFQHTDMGESKLKGVLNEEKQKVLSLVLDGASIFLAGDAGTGKSFLLRHIAKALKAKGLHVAVTASTGIAALQIDGNTFHSTFGVPVVSEDERRVATMDCRSLHIYYDSDVLSALDVIIVDEVSLLHLRYIEALDKAARAAYGKARHVPFGGIQVILSGDFMQLIYSGASSNSMDNESITCSRVKLNTDKIPQNVKEDVVAKVKPTEKSEKEGLQNVILPVLAFDVKDARRRKGLRHSSSNVRDRPLFKSCVFLKCLLHVKLCTHVRQGEDLDFLEDLKELRCGVLTYRLSRSAFLNPEDPNAIRLFPTRRAVAAFHTKKMLELRGEERCFRSEIRFGGKTRTETQSQLFDGNKIFIIVHFRSKSMRSLHWRGEAEMLLRELTCSCGISKLVRILIPLSPPRYSKHLTAYLQFDDVEGHDINKHVDIMSSTIGAYFLGASKKAVAARKLWGKVLWEVRPMNHVKRKLRDALRHRYNEVLRHDSIFEQKRLKIGCRVMLLRNLTTRYVNGSLGTLMDFQPLSRVAHLVPEGIRLKHFSQRSLTQRQVGLLPANSFHAMNETTCEKSMDEHTVVPIVRMDIDAKEGKEVAIPWISFPLLENNELGFCSARVRAMPLVPAYAFTVHKVQGITFNHSVLFDASGFFPCNHLIYVAASRVQRFSQLRMINVSPCMVTVHRGALHFSLGIPCVNEAMGIWKEWVKKKNVSLEELGSPISGTKMKRKLVLFRASWKLKEDAET